MRVFLKNLFRIAGGTIAVGIVLVIVALGMDNRVYTKWQNVDISYGDGWGIWNGGSNYGEEVSAEDTEVKDTGTDNTYPVTYQKVKSLDFHIFAGKLYIKEGDKFTLEVRNEGKNRISSEVKNGIWTLEEINTKQKASGKENKISVFGIDIDLDNTVSRKDLTEVYVTLPKGFTADKISLSVGAGTITADSLSADTGSIKVGAGTCSIDNLTVKDSSTYQVDAGMLEIEKGIINEGTLTCNAGKIGVEDGTIHNSTISCMAGTITIGGSITGDSSISTSVGTINLDLKGKEEDYNYTIDCNLGALTLNGTKYNGINKHITQKNSAKNNMTLSCDVGTISVNID
ncbi:DUF4097 family beta strand repeat-containing protein [Anaerocolumna xylanovorans]|uniref:Putative adhesin n=1 Tax=Anaerocolumna xylanovorans DSM 12503 TaxID=1121345 RepID=A0A1M7Y0R3_9FIRM|nr:DUF4097 family beta strand repeat-containing protein [Anaerocolumna xylanovorans]SHO44970.1 Putative adhesin [Anaerocolumna xylanovorans DSM 12503]